MSQFDGVVHVMGEHDVGKSLFALQCGARPEKICYFDDDVKGRATVAKINKAGARFGAYHDLVELAKGRTELAFFNEVRKLIDAIAPGEFDAIIFDTWTNVAGKANAFVMANPGLFKTQWSPMGSIKGAQQWQETRRLEAEMINQMAQRTKTLILITHLKDHIINNVKVPGKQIPACSAVLERVPNLRLWLRHNPSSPVPIGLVLKRITLEKVVDGRIRSVNVLPRKITPRPEDESLWDTIDWYMENPVGNREPTREELPDAFEMSILSGTLTEEQKHTFNEILRAGVSLKDEEQAIAGSLNQDDMIERVRELLEQKKSLPAIAKILNLTVDEVKRLSTEVSF